ADRNRSHWSTSKTPSYTKSVSWQHHPLLQSRNDHLRQTALRNAHTPALLLTTLTEPQDRSLAINNPQLAADVKTAWLKEDPSLLLFVEQPDLSLLRDLVKTGATRKIRSEARHRLEEKQ
ncbi:DUF2773 domain-containing protein, partial [Escherichia coli]|uniref:DUF2773 domain-containing protein n=5 Tax=Enterobacteriaceae TaxID=543 RepID=UPI003D365DF5